MLAWSGLDALAVAPVIRDPHFGFAVRGMPSEVELAEPLQTIPTRLSWKMLTAVNWAGFPSDGFKGLTQIHQPHVPQFAHTTLLGHCPL